MHDLPLLEWDEEKYYSVPSTPSSKGDKKEEKGLEILTPNKLVTMVLILLAQVKAGNNSNKLKNRITEIICLLY